MSEEQEGAARIQDAVRRLDTLADRPVAEHVEVYESVHSDLQDALAAGRGEDEPGAVQPPDDAAPGGAAT